MRVLFVSESVTLAHVIRPLYFAAGLERCGWEIYLACDPRWHDFFSGQLRRLESLPSLDSGVFINRLAIGKPLYTADEIRRYVAADEELINRIRPDVIVGDFRLSLSISARRSRVPYLSICNGYWSPYAHTHFPVPDLPILPWLGVSLGQIGFDLIRKIAFAFHARPLDSVRVQYGMPKLRHLELTYTDADMVAYADAAELFEYEQLPRHHRFIGPVLWQPPVALPMWWASLPKERQVVYITQGSSGADRLIEVAVRALRQLDLTVVVGSAGRRVPFTDDNQIFHADYLPGIEMAKRSALVICNGGSLATHQALSQGVPVLGLTSNLDQMLNMESVRAAGAGTWVRASLCDEDRVRAAAESLLVETTAHRAAQRVANWMACYDPVEYLREMILHA